MVLCAGLGGSVDEKADLVLAIATSPELAVSPELASLRSSASASGPALPVDYEGLQAAFALYKKVTRQKSAPANGAAADPDDDGF